MKTKAKHRKTTTRKKPSVSGTAGPDLESGGPRQTQVLEAVLQEVTSAPAVEPMEQDIDVDCPYCGEALEIHVTTDDSGQTMTQDCDACCRPMSLHIQHEDGEFQVEAYRA